MLETVCKLEISPKTLFLHKNWSPFKLGEQKKTIFQNPSKFDFPLLLLFVENFIFIKFSTTWNVHISFYPNCLKNTLKEHKCKKWPILNTFQPSRNVHSGCLKQSVNLKSNQKHILYPNLSPFCLENLKKALFQNSANFDFNPAAVVVVVVVENFMNNKIFNKVKFASFLPKFLQNHLYITEIDEMTNSEYISTLR